MHNHGIFPVSRKRRTLGTIPVAILKDGTVKVDEFRDKDSLRVTREEALAISRQTLKRAEQERMEDRMELKPIEKMDDLACKEEVIQRLGGTTAMATYDWQTLLRLVRENDIGTENLKPPTPDWKRWRKWPEEKPVDKSDVEYRCGCDSYEAVFIRGLRYPFVRSAPGRIVEADNSSVTEWRYLTKPLTWKRMQDPDIPGWYWVRRSWASESSITCAFWTGTRWRRSDQDSDNQALCYNDVIAYYPIAPAPKFEEDKK